MFIFNDPTHQEWTRFDIILANAMRLRDDMLVGGVPIYLDRSDRVAFEVGSYISKSKAVLDRAEEKARKSKTPTYGKVLYPIPRTIDGGPLPTMEEYLEQEARKKAMSAGKIRVGGEAHDNSNWKPKSAPGLD